MKLENSTSVFNMGDTSIRVKQIVEVNKVILKELYNFFSERPNWNRNKEMQESFYKSFLDEIVRLEHEEGIELFNDFKRHRNYEFPSKNRIGFRGRTLTNSLVKIGLVDSSRNISTVGHNYLNGTLKNADVIEKLLELDIDNLIYFRQLLKLRIYDFESDNYFYNFRFALKFLQFYDDVPQNNFFKLLESISPKQSQEELDKIIFNYREVHENKISFDDYYNSIFTEIFITSDQLYEARRMFNNQDFTDEMFIKVFTNRDRAETSLLYKDFVMKLINIQENRSDDEVIESLYLLSRENIIKKAFGDGKIPIEISRNDTIDSFLKKNINNPLLDDDHFNKYLKFIFSKRNDLIREYSDMARRIFQVSGVINFRNGVVSLNNKWIISPLIQIIEDKFELAGNSPYSEYEENLNSQWFDDVSLTELFSISNIEINMLLNQLAEEFGIEDLSEISQLIDERHENEYRNFVENRFPKKSVIQILEYISNRNDEEVFRLVTDSANIPTIYEYILTIAWYHLSADKSFKLSHSFQVSLDGNKLPQSHRGGGVGDIEIYSDKYKLLLEATLMDTNNQKRNELEPVIRHSLNFSLDNSPDQTQTIFIANELDNNTLNIFRSMQFVQLNGTFKRSLTHTGLNIFAITTNELIQLLEKDISDIDIINTINKNYDTSPRIIFNGWREKIIDSLLKTS